MARKSAFGYGAEAGEQFLALLKTGNQKERIKRQSEVVVGMRKGTHKIFQTKKANRWWLQGFDTEVSPSTKRASGPYKKK